MALYTFEDRDNIAFMVPAGDYVMSVVTAEMQLSKKGDDMIALVLQALPSGVEVKDYLMLSGKAARRLDTFLKAMKRAPTKGDTIDFTDEWLKKNVVGALGWATLEVEVREFQGKTYQNNKVSRWITSGKEDPARTIYTVPATSAVLGDDLDVPIECIPF